MPNSHDEMTYIVNRPHAFDDDMVLAKHQSRMNEPEPITTTYASGLQVKTEASQLARFCCYDSFEAFDIIYLSRLAIESLILLSVRASVNV